MGICAKHDWASLGPERCPSCVSEEYRSKGLGVLETFAGFHALRQIAAEADGELEVLRTMLKQKEQRTDELCALVDSLRTERDRYRRFTDEYREEKAHWQMQCLRLGEAYKKLRVRSQRKHANDDSRPGRPAQS